MQLRGRHDEIGEVRRVLADGSGGLAITADHGAGLSMFLDDIAEQSADLGLNVLRGAGRRGESHIALALLRELAGREAAGALAAALTDAAGAQPAETVFAWAQGAPPTAIIVDDAQDADEHSVAALHFLARRTGHSVIVVLVGTHGDTDLDSVMLGPLDASDLAAIASDRFDLAESVARRIGELAAGSPLVAVELARGLDDRQRRGTAALPSFPAASVPIHAAFEEPIRSLADDVRRALCLAAAEPTGELRVISRALSVLGDDVGALETAESVGVIQLGDGVVQFDHPIRQGVCYRQLAPASRRAAHRALALALDAPTDAERRAAHLSVGVIEPDEGLAADLEFVAELAERRRDWLEAARWWTSAARISPDSADADRRRERASAAGVPRSDPIAGLTKAERRVASVVGGGATNKEAAANLYVSVKTVDAHLQSIYRKLGIRSRAELAVLMTRLHIGEHDLAAESTR